MPFLLHYCCRFYCIVVAILYVSLLADFTAFVISDYTEWKFYDSKYKYAIQERKDSGKGRFLQLKPGSDGSLAPFPSFDSPKTGRKADRPGSSSAPASILSVELQTSTGTMMRIQGDMTPEHLAAIIQSSSRHV